MIPSDHAQMQLLKAICAIPTAPFVEDRVVTYVERFMAERPKLRLRRDDFGNLLIELPGRGGRAAPRWIFAAHMDHPGFVARRMIDARTLAADFRGGVRPKYVEKARVRFFMDGAEVKGQVEAVTTPRGRRFPTRVQVRVDGAVPPGAAGMFDQGAGTVRGKRFYSRVCDNLAGAAAALAMLDELRRRPPRATVAVLLTRAEETGFTGALAACDRPKLLKKSDRLVVIECSAAQPYAPQGKGVIVRVGDRTSIFNSDLTYFITRTAEDLAKKDERFQYQRALMPGGSCEATVYDVYGYMASAICIALGNYHNMTPTAGRIGPEFISIDDWQNMVKLFVHLARTGHRHEPGHALLKRRLEKLYDSQRRLHREIATIGQR